MSRWRTCLVALSVLVGLYIQCREEVAQLPASQGPRWSQTGADLLDPEVREPLTRQAVLVRSQAAPATMDNKRSLAQRPLLLRRDTVGPADSLEEEWLLAEDAPVVLQRALDALWEERASLTLESLASAHRSLSAMWSIRGQYQQALLAAQVAVSKATSGLSDKDSFTYKLWLGSLELRHHRYEAAGRSFQVALDHPGVSNKTAAAALVGAGWALLHSGSSEAAQELLEAAARSLSLRTDSAGAHCKTFRDGFDEHRAIIAAGLSLVLHHRATRSPLPAATHRLKKCKELLQRPPPMSAADFRGPESLFPEPRAAMSLAFLSLGLPDDAAQLIPQADPLCRTESQSFDLPRCVYVTLLEAAVKQVKGDAIAALHKVAHVLAQKLHQEVRSEVTYWLQSFARSLSWMPLGRDLELLFSGLESAPV